MLFELIHPRASLEPASVFGLVLKLDPSNLVNVDVYPNWFHAYDMLLPFKKISKKAIAEFEKQYLHAVEHYFAKQK